MLANWLAGPSPEKYWGLERSMIKAVIFDMDGLMLDTEALAFAVWKSSAAHFGLSLDDEHFFSMIGRNAADSNKALVGILGDAFPLETLHQHVRQNFLLHIEENGIQVKPGLFELLDFLDEKGVLKAVATSSSRGGCQSKLELSQLNNRFQAIVCGDEVPAGKPAPDIFIKAAARLEVVPEQCLVLEDSYAGIRAAYAAGMVPVMVPDLLQPTDEIRTLAHVVVPSLTEAISEIRKLL